MPIFRHELPAGFGNVLAMRPKPSATKDSGTPKTRPFSRPPRAKGVILLTKDKDFADLVDRLGPPPTVIWLRCGNTSEVRLKEILSNHLENALAFIGAGDSLVEIQ